MSNSILDLVTQQLSGDALTKLSGQLGASEGATASAVSAALPMLVGAMARNVSSQEGAQSLSNALEKDHDGSILDNLGGFLTSSDNGPGAGILKHVLGNKRTAVENGIGKMSGMNSNMVGGLLENLAPIVMGQLGQMKRKQGLDAGGLASILMGANNTQKTSTMGGAAMGMLMNILDQDNDGNIIDDVGGMLGGLFGKK